MKNKKTVSSLPTLSKEEIALRTAAAMDKEELLKHFHTTTEGYDEDTVEELQDEHGYNEISRDRPDPLYKRIASAFLDPFTLVLFFLAFISLLSEVVLAAPGHKDPSTALIICVMVLLSGSLRFVQETRSNHSAERLKEMVHTTAAVIRKEAGTQELPLDEIVPGDIIHLAAGDMIPADVRILNCKDLFVSQASLTGESAPIEKFSSPLPDTGKSSLELNNLAFMGSNVISGSALCIVLETGDHTCFGSMAKAISAKPVQTSFDKGVRSVSKLLIRFMLCMAPIVFLVNGLTKGDWLQAFLFALSVAVGLTPEMLPMIVTTNLARGAVTMAKEDTIVKRMDSMQNFGAMDVLCTDKTGTLTQDKVVLEQYLDIHGNKDERILRHAFLNSYYQTGLRNLMDKAILEHAKSEPYHSLQENYTKVDEIPFDFNRRRMSVVIKSRDGKTQMITKGAIEEMLSISSFTEYGGSVVPLTDALRSEILLTVGKLNSGGMRVLGVAQKTNPSVEGVFSVQDESDMVLIGYLAFLDPPKESAADAIKSLHAHGVTVKVLTGDNDLVTGCICRKVGIPTEHILLGSDVGAMSEEDLSKAVEKVSVFAKLSPQQKARVVTALRNNGHTVGYMGDGINDAAAMHASDVGISVDTAVDIAKESADIILLKKDLSVLMRGVLEGRRTFGNIIKYIKMSASSNFGNMFSVVTASVFLPFLPMQPIQILFLNLIYDFSCIAIPWDNMDEEYLTVPRKWDASSIKSFMFWMGPTSSVFDITTYLLMFFGICPAVLGGAFGMPGVSTALFVSLFNTGWFVESLWSQTLVIHMIRTPKTPFVQSRASTPVLIGTFLSIAAGTIVPFTPLGTMLKMHPLPVFYYPWLLLIILGYMALATIQKKLYIKRHGELL